MPFLDTKVTINGKYIRTTVFRKKTDTGVILNQSAVAPMSWKRSLTSCFLHRAKIICSDKTAHEEEIEKLRKIFYQNNYTNEFFNQAITKFENKRNKQQTQAEQDNKSDKMDFKIMVKIPFIGKPSVVYGNRLKKAIKHHLDEQVSVLYETTKVKDSFKIKDNIPKEICSQIVYKFTCPGDPETSYIGHTIRNLRERVKEHLNPNNGTAVGNHVMACEECQQRGASIDDFSILRRCRSRIGSAIQEALLIKKQKPILNKQFSKSTGYSFTLKIFNA